MSGVPVYSGSLILSLACPPYCADAARASLHLQERGSTAAPEQESQTSEEKNNARGQTRTCTARASSHTASCKRKDLPTDQLELPLYDSPAPLHHVSHAGTTVLPCPTPDGPVPVNQVSDKRVTPPAQHPPWYPTASVQSGAPHPSRWTAANQWHQKAAATALTRHYLQTGRAIVSHHPEQNHSSAKALRRNVSRVIKSQEHHLLFACHTDPTIEQQDDVNSSHSMKPLKGAVDFQSGLKHQLLQCH
jgi:hypothetical protein